MDTHEIHKKVEEALGTGEGELGRVIHTFKCERPFKGGGSKSVVVEILDCGPDLPERLVHNRYIVTAYDEDGRYATGNGGDTIEVAIATTHWHKLDSDPPDNAAEPWRGVF